MEVRVRINKRGEKVVMCAKCGKWVRAARDSVWHENGYVLCERHDSEYRQGQSIDTGVEEYVAQ